jgi:hypothetical protein
MLINNKLLYTSSCVKCVAYSIFVKGAPYTPINWFSFAHSHSQDAKCQRLENTREKQLQKIKLWINELSYYENT